MKLPIIPILVAAILLAAVIYFLNSTGSAIFVLDAPRLDRVADIEGIETEVAVTNDGIRYAVVSSGEIWLYDTSNSSSRRITQTSEPEHFPAWTPDGLRLTFSRGADTFVIAANNPDTAEVFKADATSLAWSPTGRIAFVRDRGLWLADPNGANERQVVEPSTSAEVTIRTPRFSPDSLQLAFIKTIPGLQGQVWLLNVLTGAAVPLVADRQAENPLDVGWIHEGRNLVYLTDRSGSFAIWLLDLAENTLIPLTPPLFGVPLDEVGMAVWKDRIVLPRHFVDSDITWGDATPIIQTDDIEFEPSVSPNGQSIAYTIAKENKFEIWTAGITGESPVFRTLGREPRFSPNGYQIVYTHTDLTGNPDLWTLDLRDNNSDVVTDADEIDINPDWSKDGRTIAFASNRAGHMSVWAVSTSGGKRFRLNEAGYYPRYSPDSQTILLWNKNALWTMPAAGGGLRLARENVPGPVPGVWTKDGPRYHADPEVSGGRQIWPLFDVVSDGRTVIAPIEIRGTELWSVELTYRQTN